MSMPVLAAHIIPNRASVSECIQRACDLFMVGELFEGLKISHARTHAHTHRGRVSL